MDRTRLVKGLLSFLLLVLVFVTILTPPVSGFEPSVYSGFPDWYWGLFCVILGVVSLCLIFDLKWKIALVTGLATHIVYLGLPLLRGYYLYGRGAADTLAHLGFAVDIQKYNIVDLSGMNFYPILHVWIVETAEIGGIELRVAIMLLNVIFTPLFIVGMYLYARELFDHQIATSVAAFAIPLSFGKFHHTTHPAMFSFLLLPLLLMLFEAFQRRYVDRTLSVIAPVILATAIMLFHPMTAILAIIAITVSTVYHGKETGWSIITQPVSYFYLLTGILFSAWYLAHPRGLDTVGRMVVFLVTGGTNVLETETGAANQTILTGVDLALRGLDLYGMPILICGVAGIGLMVYLGQFIETRQFNRRTYISVQFLLGIAITVALLTGFVVTIDPVRAVRYAVLFAILVCGVLFSDLLSGGGGGFPSREATTAVIVVLFVIAMPLSISSYENNLHLTESESEGADWITELRDPGHPVESHQMGPKLTWYHQGDAEGRQVSPFTWHENTVYKELGYRENTTIGDTYSEWSYLFLKEQDRRYNEPLPEEQREQRDLYDEQHVERLNSDPTASHIYTNGGAETWLVTPNNAS